MDRRKFVCVVVLLTLISIGAYSIQMKNLNAGGDYTVTFESTVDISKEPTNLGSIWFDHLEHVCSSAEVLYGGTAEDVVVEYVPAPGYCFVRWFTYGYITIDDLNARVTTADYTGPFDLVAMYKACPPVPSHVGGEVFSANKAVVVAPYLMALISIVTVAAVVVKRRRA